MIGFKAIVPKKLDVEAMESALRGEMEKYKPFLIKDYENIVKSWGNPKPTFQAAVYVRPEGTTLVVRVLGPDEGRKKWIYVNEGTRPHTIRPKNAKLLAFPAAYSAGSSPGSIFTIKGSAKGPVVFAREVNHPGSAARNFDKVLAENHRKPFESWMQAAMSKAARASGHGIK